jgi:hypothetical protein
MVGCAVRTEKKMQAIDAGCAWRTLQTLPYMNAVILRINQGSPKYHVNGSGKNLPQVA